MQARRQVEPLLQELNSDAYTTLNQYENNCYNNLYRCCLLLQKNQDNISRFQFDEEYDALICVIAYISQYYIQNRTSTRHATAMQVPAGFMEFLQKLIAMKPERVAQNQNAIYEQVIDWGCYIQKKEREKLVEPTLTAEKQRWERLLKLATPEMMSEYKAYEANKTAKRLASYKWYVETLKARRQKLLKETKLWRRYGSFVFFFIPLAYFAACTVNHIRYRTPLSWRLVGGLAVAFIVSLIPPLSSFMNFKFTNSLAKRLELEIRNNGGFDDAIQFQKAEEYNSDRTELGAFRKAFKQTHQAMSAESKSSPGSAECKSSPPLCVEKAQDTVVGVYRDREKSRRDNFYRYYKTQPGRPAEKNDDINRFFRERPASKQKSRATANEVMLKHQRAQEAEQRKAQLKPVRIP